MSQKSERKALQYPGEAEMHQRIDGFCNGILQELINQLGGLSENEISVIRASARPFLMSVKVRNATGSKVSLSQALRAFQAEIFVQYSPHPEARRGPNWIYDSCFSFLESSLTEQLHQYVKPGRARPDVNPAGRVFHSNEVGPPSTKETGLWLWVKKRLTSHRQ